ncbi:hypothetical protein GCM10009716_00060 [Streptomyces sodiiphilus]|uniref:Uncharacterized protein n=1 Tax=Streptomyces sodiiphilus TaxID=226217 RepID=A0ABN2NQ12_9ACTN
MVCPGGTTGPGVGAGRRRMRLRWGQLLSSTVGSLAGVALMAFVGDLRQQLVGAVATSHPSQGATFNSRRRDA